MNNDDCKCFWGLPGRCAHCDSRLRIVHVLRRGEPVCPQCKQGLEAEGGSVVPRGSMDEGPLWWACEECETEWGHA